MIPMIAASTAAAFLPSASPAALPSITTSTFSPTPAPTESIAISATPRGCVVDRQRLDEQQLRALELAVLLRRNDGADDARDLHQAQTLPPCLRVPVVDDADDRGVGRRLGGIERKRGLAAADEEDVLANAGADRIERDERAAGRLAGRRRAAGARAASIAVRFASFDRRDDFADDARELHCASSRVPDFDGVDDADDGGIDRAILQARRHARRAAADDEHRLADARVDRVDGDEVVAFGLAARDPSGARRAACC